MKEKLGILGTLTFGASLALSACAQEAKPSESFANIQDVMRNGITITEDNFDQFFIECSSREQLIKTAKDQGKEIFPLLFDSPENLAIKVESFSDQSPTADLITARKPISFIAPVSGPIIANGTSQKDDFIVFTQIGTGKFDFGLINSIRRDNENEKKAEIEIQFNLDSQINIFKHPGDYVSEGDPILQFISSGPFSDTELANTFVIWKVEYSGGNADYYSSDLSTYVTLEGKVVYCSSKQIPLQTEQVTAARR